MGTSTKVLSKHTLRLVQGQEGLMATAKLSDNLIKTATTCLAREATLVILKNSYWLLQQGEHTSKYENRICFSSSPFKALPNHSDF